MVGDRATSIPGTSMPLRHLVVLAAALTAATALTAAVADRAAAQGAMPCANDIMPMRQEADKQGNAIKAAAERKADRGEMCSLLKKFAATEQKFVKYLEDNSAWCGVPPEVIKQVKANHGRTLEFRNKACAAGPAVGPAGPAVPAGPGLSEALGTIRVPTESSATPGKGGGTLDTMTGNALKR